MPNGSRSRGGRRRGRAFRICSFYSRPKGCTKGDECYFLHICCALFDAGGCPSGRQCPYNHEFTDYQTARVLQEHNIDPYRDFEELLDQLRPKVKAQLAKDGSHGREEEAQDLEESGDIMSRTTEPEDDDLGPSLHFPTYDEDDGDEDGAEEDEGDDVISNVSSTSQKSGPGKRRRGRRPRGGRGKRKSSTATSDVSTETSEPSTVTSLPEICTFHVKGRCNNGDECPKLHRPSKLPYQWQALQNDNWVYLDSNANRRIEESFCDPSVLEMQIKLGRIPYTVEFDTMSIFRPAESHNYQEIRRLSTMATVKNRIESVERYCTHWVWYWEDERGRWKEYTKQTSPNQHSITDSNSLEKAYQKYLHNGPASRPLASPEYCIKFEEMIQTVAGGKPLNVCRRPKPYASVSDGETKPEMSRNVGARGSEERAARTKEHPRVPKVKKPANSSQKMSSVGHDNSKSHTIKAGKAERTRNITKPQTYTAEGPVEIPKLMELKLENSEPRTTSVKPKDGKFASSTSASVSQRMSSGIHSNPKAYTSKPVKTEPILNTKPQTHPARKAEKEPEMPKLIDLGFSESQSDSIKTTNIYSTTVPQQDKVAGSKTGSAAEKVSSASYNNPNPRTYKAGKRNETCKQEIHSIKGTVKTPEQRPKATVGIKSKEILFSPSIPQQDKFGSTRERAVEKLSSAGYNSPNLNTSKGGKLKQTYKQVIYPAATEAVKAPQQMPKLIDLGFTESYSTSIESEEILYSPDVPQHDKDAGTTRAGTTEKISSDYYNTPNFYAYKSSKQNQEVYSERVTEKTPKDMQNLLDLGYQEPHIASINQMEAESVVPDQEKVLRSASASAAGFDNPIPHTFKADGLKQVHNATLLETEARKASSDMPNLIDPRFSQLHSSTASIKFKETIDLPSVSQHITGSTTASSAEKVSSSSSNNPIHHAIIEQIHEQETFPATRTVKAPEEMSKSFDLGYQEPHFAASMNPTEAGVPESVVLKQEKALSFTSASFGDLNLHASKIDDLKQVRNAPLPARKTGDLTPGETPNLPHHGYFTVPQSASVKPVETHFSETTVPKQEDVGSTTIARASSEEVYEICPLHLNDKCKSGDSCFRLHLQSPYQWQYKTMTPAGVVWQNFSDRENTNIEQTFCEPSADDVTVFIEGDYFVQKFSNSLIDSNDGRYGDEFRIRRLSTMPTVKCRSPLLEPFCIEWLWYWKDEHEKWIQYAQKNAKDMQSDVDGITLEIAYEDYLGGVGATVYPFRTHKNNYHLNFQTMFQRNLHYRTEREVRRRPKFITMAECRRLASQNRFHERKQDTSNIPETWDMRGMANYDELKLIRLDIYRHQREYMDVADMFWNTMDDKDGNIIAIKRVQNLELWEDFTRKRERMTKKNGGQLVLEKKLWHGTKQESSEAICQQNFDFRISGSNVGTLYGQGSYFARDASYSDRYSTPENNMHRMFLVRVLVGSYVAGKSEYKRPPPRDSDNPLGDLHDSCVDKVDNPSIYVIFDKCQAYPEYLIEYERSSTRPASTKAAPSVPRASSNSSVRGNTPAYSSSYNRSFSSVSSDAKSSSKNSKCLIQ